MRNGLRVLDSDLHVMEPVDLWLRYIAKDFKERAPVGTSAGVPRLDGVRLPGRSQLKEFMSGWFEPLTKVVQETNANYAFALKRDWDGVSQLEAMDHEGIDVAVLFPTRGLFVLGEHTKAYDPTNGLEPDYAAAIARAYNDWMYDLCAADRSRLVGAGMLAVHDIPAAIAETRRCSEELGFRAMFVLPGLVDRRAWHDPAYDPLWAELERHDMPIGFHGGGPNNLTDYGLDLWENHMMHHTLQHALGAVAAAVSMTAGGVFERFPKLKAAFLEANCSWAPWLFGRLDDHYEDYTGRFIKKLPKLPSEYFLSNCFVSVESDEKAVQLYVQWFGDDNIVYSTDYPHPDSKFPHGVERFLKLPISEVSKRKILWDNCARLYGL